MTATTLLGVDAVEGDPDAIDTVAAFLRASADDITTVSVMLARQDVGSSWDGAAAAAFRDTLRHTPHDLGRAAKSYELAADSVGRYAVELRRARDRAGVLAGRIADLQAQIGSTAGAGRAAREALDAARRSAMSGGGEQRTAAHHAIEDALHAAATADARQAALEHELTSVRRQAADNRRSLDAAARAAGEQLRAASHQGIRNSLGSWLHRHTGALRAAAAVVESACDLAPALIRYMEDPSWKRLSDVLDHLSAALTVTAVVLTVAAGILTGGAALSAIPDVLVGVKAANAAVDATKLGIDVYRRAALHDCSVSDVDLAADALSIALSGEDAESFRGQARGWIRGIHKDTAPAWKTWAAKVAVYGDGRPLSLRALVHARKRMLVDQAQTLVEESLREQVADLVRAEAPDMCGGAHAERVPRPRSSAVRITHTITVPATVPRRRIALEAR